MLQLPHESSLVEERNKGRGIEWQDSFRLKKRDE